MSDWTLPSSFGQLIVKDGCGVFGMLRKPGAPRIPNQHAVKGLACIKYRGSDLGAGYACFDSSSRNTFRVKAFVNDELVHTAIIRGLSELLGEPVRVALQRHSLKTSILEAEYTDLKNPEGEIDLMVDAINSSLLDDKKIMGRIFSYGKSVSVFKEVGYPLDVAKIFGLDKDDQVLGDVWIAHTRQPTNSPGSSPIWSHPFCAFDCAIVHNGDISSFGANLEFLRSIGFKSHVGTDSEVISRLLNFLIRKERLTVEEACALLTNPFEENSVLSSPRVSSKYRGAKLDGPFAVVAGYADEEDTYLIALTDRSKFRPVIIGEDDHCFYVASEEVQIRALSPEATVWTPEPGSYFVASAKSGLISSGRRHKKQDFSGWSRNFEGSSDSSIDAAEMTFAELNDRIRESYSRGQESVSLQNVAGHRYLGIGATRKKHEGKLKIRLEGFPGNCLANLNDGADFEVFGNVADDLADTMHSGKVVIHGSARDVVGQALQGGDVMIRGSVGNRAAIQMREYKSSRPFIVIGENADDYLGEYMAGGVVLLLNLSGREYPVGNYVGTGMVGGTIYIRGKVGARQVGLPPKKADVMAYLEVEKLEGNISPEAYDSLSKLSFPSEEMIFRLLPDKFAKRLRTLFFRSKYTKPVSVEYRIFDSRTDDLPTITRKLEDFFSTFDIPDNLRKLVLESKYTVIRTPSEVDSETPIPPQEVPVEE